MDRVVQSFRLLDILGYLFPGTIALAMCSPKLEPLMPREWMNNAAVGTLVLLAFAYSTGFVLSNSIALKCDLVLQVFTVIFRQRLDSCPPPARYSALVVHVMDRVRLRYSLPKNVTYNETLDIVEAMSRTDGSDVGFDRTRSILRFNHGLVGALLLASCVIALPNVTMPVTEWVRSVFVSMFLLSIAYIIMRSCRHDKVSVENETLAAGVVALHTTAEKIITPKGEWKSK